MELTRADIYGMSDQDYVTLYLKSQTVKTNTDLLSVEIHRLEVDISILKTRHDEVRNYYVNKYFEKVENVEVVLNTRVSDEYLENLIGAISTKMTNKHAKLTRLRKYK